ncbi:MAG: hypothetical protein ACLFM3_07205, partial [Desulfohalobiaceae bacterium]
VKEHFVHCQPKNKKNMANHLTYKQLTKEIEQIKDIFLITREEFAAKTGISWEAIQTWRENKQNKKLDLKNDQNLLQLKNNLHKLHPSLNPQALEDKSQELIEIPHKKISDELRLCRVRGIFWELDIKRSEFEALTGIRRGTQDYWFFNEALKIPELKPKTIKKLFYNIEKVSPHINPQGLFNRDEPLWRSSLSPQFTWETDHIPLHYNSPLKRAQKIIEYWDISIEELYSDSNISNYIVKTFFENPSKIEKMKTEDRSQQLVHEKCLLHLRNLLAAKLLPKNKQLNLEWFYFGTGEPYTYIEQRQDRAANEPYLDSGPETTQSIRYDSQYGSPKSPSLQTQEPTSKFGSLLQALQKLLKPLLEDKEYYHKIINHLMDRYYHQHTKEREDLAIKTLAEIHDIQRFCKEEEYNDKLIAQNIILVLEGFYGPLRDHNTRKNHPFDNNKEENSG